MYEAKTKETKASVKAFLDAQEPARRADCKKVAALMKDVTGASPKMWGTSIVGFGSRHFRYASGHEGDTCILGFSPRKAALTLYVPGLGTQTARLKRLGKHKSTGGCLYVSRLADVDLDVLREVLTEAVTSVSPDS